MSTLPTPRDLIHPTLIKEVETASEQHASATRRAYVRRAEEFKDHAGAGLL